MGEEKGYLTFKEIADELPDELLVPEKVENIVKILEELDINVQEDEIDIEERVESEEYEIEEEIIDNTPPDEKIEKQLIELRKYVESDFPNTEPKNRLLTDDLIRVLVAFKPTSFSEFRSEIPFDYRRYVDGEEAQSYLPEVFEIINKAVLR